jgi:class 3 adenylate cyclase
MLEHFPVLQKILPKLKAMVPLAVFWLMLTVGAGILAAQFIQDPVIVETLALSVGGLLLFWWALLAWRVRNAILMELQDLYFSNHMVSHNYPKVTGSMPWNASFLIEKLIRGSAQEYRTLIEKTKDTNKTLEKYVGTSVTEKATKRALSSELGGELRKVYVLFSDVRGFTHMTEELKPQETVEILNQMFKAMEEVIAQHGGDINKYIGDAIFAYFRRPYGSEEEAAKTVLRAALRMLERFEALNQSFKVAYSREVKIGLGIGITAGEAIVGNLGSPNRMEFTLIGDTVNMASRLCGVAKHGQILVNEEMANACRSNFITTALPPMQIKGKSEMQTPYWVQGEGLGMAR